jgi:hypothetical protein
MADHFYIGPQTSGLESDMKPFAIADNAYERLQNAYVFRGRVRKRFGSRPYSPGAIPFANEEQLQSRLRIAIGTTNAVTGNFVGSVPVSAPLTPITAPAIGQMFSIEDDIFTVVALGNPANLLRTDNTPQLATFDTTSGAVVINTGGTYLAKTVWYYPSTPVMGFAEYETHAINDEQIIAFDTNYAYTVDVNGWYRLDVAAPGSTAYWTGTDTNFFWTATWRGTNPKDNLLFVSNFNFADGLKYFFGNDVPPNRWHNWVPQVDALPTVINTARLIAPFQNRLLLLNTVENGDSYTNRVRFSWIGSPIDPLAWRSDIPGNGGFIQLPVQEAIVTAQFLRDRLIVFAERSTWELVSTGVDIAPFVFQQVNTELGAESTFSQIPFDQAVLGVGNVGIHACDGNSVKRIDEKIPDDVFHFHNDNDGPLRVAGIRDYYTQLAYWAVPTQDNQSGAPYPNRVLIYNYINSTWAYNDDSFTVFGYIQNNITPNNETWQEDLGLWQDDTSTWQNPQIAALERNVIAGNQEGYVFIIDANELNNAESLQITNVTTTAGGLTELTVINHNLNIGDAVYVNHCAFSDGSTLLDDLVFMVLTVVDANTIDIGPLAPYGTGTYLGGGTLSRVSRIDILTKQYNFYAAHGDDCAVTKVDFLVDNTASGQITMDYWTSTANLSMQTEAANTNTLLGSPILETTPYAMVAFEQDQNQFWHSMYPQAYGQFVQLRLYFTDDQLMGYVVDENGDRSFIADNDFQLHATIYNASPLTRF